MYRHFDQAFREEVDGDHTITLRGWGLRHTTTLRVWNAAAVIPLFLEHATSTYKYSVFDYAEILVSVVVFSLDSH